jgi:hypothetical protein
MATKPYTVTVDIGDEKFVLEIPLSNDDYSEFIDKEPGAIEYVLGVIRQKADVLANRDFDENNVSFDDHQISA